MLRIAQAVTTHDYDQAMRWLRWCAELGCGQGHSIYLMPIKGLDPSALVKEARKAFDAVKVVPDAWGISSSWSGSGAVRDASGPNSTIRQFCEFFHYIESSAFAFIEPDCLPLTRDAFTRLEAEYHQSGRAFMGAMVPASNGVPAHATGNMILPLNALHCEKLMLPSMANIHGQKVEIAFDVAAAPDVLRNFHPTRLIQHVFRGPSFTSRKQFDQIDPQAVFFHTCKDGSLIPYAREKLGMAVKGLTATHSPDVKATNYLAEQRIHGSITDIPMVQIPVSTGQVGGDRPSVFTYFSPVISSEGLAEQTKILEIWKREWARNGWNPVVLSEHDAAKHPQYADFKAAFAAKPSVNPAFYEMACWMRWVAMAALPDGGLMTDYDVLPNGFHGDEFDPLECTKESAYPLLLAKGVPCAVYGTKRQYENALYGFRGCAPGEEQGQPHLSDMLAVQQLGFNEDVLCCEFGDKFQHAPCPLVHFSHNACGKTRSVVMDGASKEWLSEHDPEAPPTPDPRDAELARLKAELDALKNPKPAATPKRKQGAPMKKSPNAKRTPEEQAKIDARMAKARAGRKVAA